MIRSLRVRFAGALGVTALALFFVSLLPLLSANPTAGAGLSRTPAVTVDRTFKGDRLPMASETNKAISRGEPDNRQNSRMPENVPVGCDMAFSPVASPRLAYYYGRCAT
jgi:hypothetical protein